MLDRQLCCSQIIITSGARVLVFCLRVALEVTKESVQVVMRGQLRLINYIYRKKRLYPQVMVFSLFLAAVLKFSMQLPSLLYSFMFFFKQAVTMTGQEGGKGAYYVTGQLKKKKVPLN